MTASNSGTIEPSQSPWLPLTLLLAWFAFAGPLFVRMPLTNDAILFDVQAELSTRGVVLYRDLLEPNLPGVIWLHRLVRSVGGASTEALRAFDLLVFAGTLMFAAKWLRNTSGSWRWGIWTALAIAVFYLSTSEWCHCQRDMWMLAVCAAGMTLRLRQIQRRNETSGRAIVFVWATFEGLIWGAGIWIKPYTLLIVLAVWLISLRKGSRHRFVDSFGLVAGGLAAGVAGVIWLIQAGSWPAFIETLRVWNPQYYKAGRNHWALSRFKPMVIRFAPWFFLHLLAIPISLQWLVLRFKEGTEKNVRQSMLSAAYLVWLSQSFLLQHLFDYVHAPGIILAILVCADGTAGRPQRRVLLVPLATFGVAALTMNPILNAPHAKLWARCLNEASNPELQDRLSHFTNPRRERLEAVARFLESQNIQDNELVCFNSDTVWLYSRLHVKPPIRYVYLYEILAYFPQAREQITRELEATPHRFVVEDLVSMGMDRRRAEEIGPAGPLAPPPKLPRYKERRYPTSQRVIFRNHEYLVHEVQRPLGRLQAPTP